MELATVAKQGIEFARSRPIRAMAYPYTCGAAGVIALYGLFIGMRPVNVVELALNNVGIDAGWPALAERWSTEHGWLLEVGWVILVLSFWVMTMHQLGINARVYSTVWLALALGLQSGHVPLTAVIGGLGLPLLIWIARNRRGDVDADWIVGLILALVTVLSPLFWILDPGMRYRARR